MYTYIILLTHTKEIILLYELHTIEGWKCISYFSLYIVATASAQSYLEHDVVERVNSLHMYTH